MSKYNSNFFLKLKLIEYYQITNVPESMFLVEAEYLDISIDTSSKIQSVSSPKGIIFGLGMIVTLILLSGFQLHRSLKATPVHPEMAKFEKLSISKNQKFTTAPNLSKINISTNKINKIKILAFKNAIANGKF